MSTNESQEVPSGGSTFTCVILGEDSLMIQCADILLREGHKVEAIVSGAPLIRQWATKQSVPLISPGKHLADSLSSLEFDYLFSITNLAILPDAVLQMPRRKAINFHDGPLPRYAGLYAPAWALIHGETEYGISFHEMLAEIDEGRLLKQKHFPIDPDETSLTLNTKCFSAGMEAFAELTGELAAGTVRPVEQDLSLKSYFGKYDRPAAGGFLDWTKPAEELVRLVRALDFGQYDNAFAAPKVFGRDQILVARVADVVEQSDSAPVGSILLVSDEGIVVATADGALNLRELATPHGKTVSIEEAAKLLGVGAGDAFAPLSAPFVERIDELTGKLSRAESFWQKRLSALEPLDLPYVHSERLASADSLRLKSVEVELPQNGLAASDVSVADALLMAVMAYFSRIAGQDSFHVAFRDSALAELIKGAESLTSPRVPLYFCAPSDPSINGLFSGMQRELARARKRGTWLSDAIGRYRGLADDPVLGEGGLLSIGVEIADPGTELPLREGTELLVRIAPDGRGLALHYDARVVGDSDAAALKSQLSLFLHGLAAAAGEAALAAVPLLSEEEREQVVRGWNRTEKEYPRDRCVHELFAEQAARTPDATAIVFANDSLTYSELDARANQLAHHLRDLGAGPDVLVGVQVERSLDMVVAVLGVQKAGAAYVPLDPAYPVDRIRLMVEDSGAPIVVTQAHLRDATSSYEAEIVYIDGDTEEIARRPVNAPDTGVNSRNLAYVIYTSGSTGRPKGVMVEHRNVVNFFAGMDGCIQADPPGSWLAVTSLSFDISVLEIFWTIARGFKVVIYADEARHAAGGAQVKKKYPHRPIDMGLFMWGCDDSEGSAKYELMIESAKFGDKNGFSSVWTPERHFHSFGGPFPNPSVTSAAIATVTERIAIRAGSCVLPLHHPIRVAEDWAVVDNLSDGRVGISFAAGWQPNDFVIRPENHKDAKAKMFEGIDQVRRLWRGEAIEFTNPMGKQVAVTSQPRPRQRELPFWVTTAGNPETFRQAGELGANLLTHLLGQTFEEVAEKIRVYREAREKAGHDPATGIVSLMLHTLVGEDTDEVRELARGPMKTYLGSSMALVKGFAWAFPAFKRPGGPNAKPDEIDLGSLTAEETEVLLDFAFERYFETSGLFGSVERCVEIVDMVKGIDVDEIACLIDYGVPTDLALASLEGLARVRELSNVASSGAKENDVDLSLRAQVERHEITHMQCTPSMARMLVLDDDAKAALGRIGHLMIGGEAFPLSLAHDLDGVAGGRVTNMYGPTETTIWSSTSVIEGRPGAIDIGHPIANTQLYIVDDHMQPMPAGVEGELLIGGDGVVRGYHQRPDLTAERFILDPFASEDGGRLYRTGDSARHNPDGTVDFIGRRDQQVKIRGYRIELGEIETRLGQHAGVRECVVIVREDVPGDQRLTAYVAAESEQPEVANLREHLSETLPEFMIPAAFCFLDTLPLTPNGKIDRKSLPPPEQQAPRSQVEYRAPENELERVIADVWQKVLLLDNVGVGDNFFEIGGHSLLVVQVHRELKSVVTQPLSLTDLYRFPTIQSLVEYLQNGASQDGGARGVERAEKRKAALGRRRQRRRPSQ